MQAGSWDELFFFFGLMQYYVLIYSMRYGVFTSFILYKCCWLRLNEEMNLSSCWHVTLIQVLFFFFSFFFTTTVVKNSTWIRVQLRVQLFIQVLFFYNYSCKKQHLDKSTTICKKNSTWIRVTCFHIDMESNFGSCWHRYISGFTGLTKATKLNFLKINQKSCWNVPILSQLISITGNSLLEWRWA